VLDIMRADTMLIDDTDLANQLKMPTLRLDLLPSTSGTPPGAPAPGGTPDPDPSPGVGNYNPLLD
jgi:hypothetical protein